MAARRRRAKRREEVTDDQERWLRGERTHGFFEFALGKEDYERFWHEHAERVIAEHIETCPGTRPRLWWRYDAPERRRRLGGIGTPQHEVFGCSECYEFGVPTCWVEPWMPAYYSGVAKDIHGNPINEQAFGKEFKGKPINPDDPPRFESQAAYLKRLGLLRPEETKRLKKRDFDLEYLGL